MTASQPLVRPAPVPPAVLARLLAITARDWQLGSTQPAAPPALVWPTAAHAARAPRPARAARSARAARASRSRGVPLVPYNSLAGFLAHSY